jgi:hypothetical protein
MATTRLIVSPQIKRLLARNYTGRLITDFLRDFWAVTPSIAEIRFRTYLREPGLDKRIGALIKTRKIIFAKLSAHLRRRATGHGCSLWETLARTSAKHDLPIPEQLLREALVHYHSEKERTFVVPRREFVEGGIESLLKRIDVNESLSICSEVRIDRGFTMHLPLLDFACPISNVNRSTIEKMLGLIGHAGVLANSGNSYHFVGVSLLTADEWVRFIGQSLLLSPFVDARFLGHRLFDGECRLRVFASNSTMKISTPIVQSIIT